MNKREAVLNLLDKNRKQEYIPAGFFIHFDKAHQQGQPAVDKHLEYFRYTGMDFVKIQYENVMPLKPEIQTSGDWAKIPLYKKDFYQNQLDIVEGLVKAAKKEALVIMTLYSPFMCANDAVGMQTVTQHIKEDPENVKKGIAIITESLMLFVKECIRLGVDGFYTSTQGSETHRFEGSPLFDECVKPYDLTLMEEINQSCIFNILHICDYHGGYSDLTPFLDYPGHVVNCNLTVGSEKMTGEQVSRMFNRPFMGGIDRKGVIAHGNTDEITQMINGVLSEAPDKFILGADCTLPGDASWDTIKTVIAAAHQHKN